MDKQVYSFIRKKRVVACMIAVAVASLGGSLYWAPLHAGCLVTALSCGALASFFLALHSHHKDKWFNIVATWIFIFPMQAVVNQSPHFYAETFQYLGFLFLVFPIGLLFFESRMQIKRDPDAIGQNLDHPV